MAAAGPLIAPRSAGESRKFRLSEYSCPNCGTLLAVDQTLKRRRRIGTTFGPPSGPTTSSAFIQLNKNGRETMNLMDVLARSRRSTLALLFSSAVAANCASMYGASAQASGEPIKIGGMFSTTGNLAGAGSEALAGAQILIEEVNAAGGVDGRTLQIVHVDDKSRPELAVSLLKRLIQRDRVVAIAGPASTVVSASLSPILNESKVAAVGCICFMGPITPNEFSTFPLFGIMQMAISRSRRTPRRFGVRHAGGFSGRTGEAHAASSAGEARPRNRRLRAVSGERHRRDAASRPAPVEWRAAHLRGRVGAPTALIAKNFKQVSLSRCVLDLWWQRDRLIHQSRRRRRGCRQHGRLQDPVYRELPDSDPVKARLTSFAEKYVKKTGKEPGLYAAYGYDTALSLVEAFALPDRIARRSATRWSCKRTCAGSTA